MKFRLETPKAVIDAKSSQKGLNWALELLIFLAVFIVVTLGEVIIQLPAQIVMLFTNKSYITAMMTGDMELAVQASTEIVASNAYTITMLFSTIAMILLTMLFCKLIQKRKMTTLGFVKKGMVTEYLIGLLIGFVIFSLAVLLCVVTGSLKLSGISSTFNIWVLVLFFAGYMIQGMAEEVLCRSYLLVSIARRYPMWLAVLLNSLFFAALHLGNSGISVLAFINLTLFGVFASVYFIKRGSIWGIGAIHSIWNFVQGNFYGIKVSGMETSCTVFDSISVEGKGFINGGDFGLEGGLAVTLVLVVGTIILLLRPAKYKNEMTASPENTTIESPATKNTAIEGTATENAVTENI